MPPQANPKTVDDAVVMRDFPGLQSYSDPHDSDKGAGVVQVNAVCLRPGELRVRQGIKRVKFDQ